MLLLSSLVSCKGTSHHVAVQLDGPLSPGTRSVLLFDDAVVDSKDGFELTMNPATRTDTPVLSPEMDWEEGGCTVPTVIAHDGLYRMWYVATTKDGERRLCYATSKDGINWIRPSLGLYEYNGDKNNNIVFTEAGSVFLDPVAEPAQRFKMIEGWGTKWKYRNVFDGGARFRYTDKPPETWHYSGVSGAYSSDGIRWTECGRNPIMPWYTDTRNVAFWDDQLKKYVAYIRWNEHFEVGDDGLVRGSFDYRAIGRSESDDFENFPEPKKILEPDFDRAEDADLWGGGLYDTAAHKYPLADDAYFFFIAAYHHTSDTLDIQLATSREGVCFRRWHEPFVRLGLDGSFDSKMMYMGIGMLPIGDEIWMYYGGYDALHDQSEDGTYRPSIGRIRVRRDGFVSQDAAAEGGTLTTIPVVVQGSELEVNMDASSRGGLRVEIMDNSGRMLKGFSGDDADRLDGNNVRNVATWKGNSDLSSLKGKTVRLRFVAESVKLYSFRFSEAPAS